MIYFLLMECDKTASPNTLLFRLVSANNEKVFHLTAILIVVAFFVNVLSIYNQDFSLIVL